MFPFDVLLCFSLSALLCSYVVYHLITNRYYNFWKNLGVPYVSPTFLFGNIKDTILGKSHISIEFDKIYRAFADEKYVGYFEFFRPHLMIKDPALIERVLIKDFHLFHGRGFTVDEQLDPLEGHLVNLSGNRWKMVRTKLAPTFSSGKLKLMTGLIEECVGDLDDHLSKLVQNEKLVDVRETMAKYATDVIGRCVFGLDFNSLKDPNSEYRKIGKKIMSPNLLSIAKDLARTLNPYLLIRLKIKTQPRLVDDFFTNLFHSAMTYRKQRRIQRNDFMQLMINLYDREISERYRPRDNSSDTENKEEEFTDNLLTANIFIFYLAGYEPTASTLSYFFYELALNPDIQNKLRNEINRSLDKYNGVLTYDVLHEMKYMDMVISETLRKYSPAHITRECAKECQIPGTSITIPAKTKLTIPIHSIHRDSKYYPEPDKFIPERFSEENASSRTPHTYLPFGYGPRICIGLRFADLEMKYCIACIVPKYQFTVCKETIVPIRLNPRSMFYKPNHDITLSVSRVV